MVNECEAAGIYTLAVTTTPKAWVRNNELAKVTRHVRAALGLHPQLVAERAQELLLWDTYVPETRYIGEVGLDAGPRFFKSFDLQKQVFEHMLRRCAEADNKILSVHCVRAATAVLDHIEAYFPPGRGKIVLHWFTGNKSEAKRAIEMGCFFSVNAAMLDNERHASMVDTIPFDRLLTETDGPFSLIDGRPSKPGDVILVVTKLAAKLNLSTTTVASRIRDNLRVLLS